MLGIVGCPGAGKSTFAAWLAEAVNTGVGSETAIALPLDGFHYTNDELVEKGLRARKGAYDTYDVEQFKLSLDRARKECAPFGWPYYSRKLHEPVPDGLTISGDARLLVVEGNYLLLDREPWTPIKGLLDEVWFLESTTQDQRERLWARHSKAGRSPEVIEQHMREVDFPNAEIVTKTRRLANKRLEVVRKDGEVRCFEIT